MSREDSSVHVLRKVVVDTLIIALLIAADILIHRVWVPFQRGFFCGDESLMFPYNSDTVTTYMLWSVGVGLPLIAFISCEYAALRKEKYSRQVFGFKIPAWVEGVYCILVCFLLGICFVEITTNIAKMVIGRPRPHFFDLCQPSVDCSQPQWQSRYIQPHEYHCLGPHTDKFWNMRLSFLSGHSSLAAYTMIFLIMYLEARMTWRGTRVLRHTLQFTAVMLSWFTALSRVSDFKHHWSDVLAGYSLGVAMAVLVSKYGTDYIEKKKEHLPLPQNEAHIVCCLQNNPSA